MRRYVTCCTTDILSPVNVAPNLGSLRLPGAKIGRQRRCVPDGIRDLNVICRQIQTEFRVFGKQRLPCRFSWVTKNSWRGRDQPGLSIKDVRIGQIGVDLECKETVMTQIQQFHRRIAALFLLSLAWVVFVATIYCSTCS